MKTKEAILKQKGISNWSKFHNYDFLYKSILGCMEEYANQSKSPIDFAEWIAENRYHRFELAETVGTDKVEYRWTDSEYQEEYTTEQLYEKFRANSITPKT